jgi:hypothetical protein
MEVVIFQYFNTEDTKNLLFALSKFPYVGGIASLLNSLLDLYDVYEGLLRFNTYKSSIKIKTGSFRFLGNFILGLAGFFPLITIASCLLINPFIIPFISLSIVGANLFKSFITIKTLQYELKIDRLVFLTEPNENSYRVLKNTKNQLYIAQRDCIINSILTFSAAVSVLGIIFPPFFMVGMCIGIIGGMLGVLDKKYFFCKKIITIFSKKETITSNTLDFKCENKMTHSSYHRICKKIKTLPAKSIATPNISKTSYIKPLPGSNSLVTLRAPAESVVCEKARIIR